MAIIHECDKCKKTNKDIKFLKTVVIAVNDEEEWYYKDLCIECIKELESFLKSEEEK